VVIEGGWAYIAEVARRPRGLSITARLSIIEEVATRLADSHGLAEVADTIGSSLDVRLGASAVVLNVLSADGNGLVTLYESGTSQRTHDLLQGCVPFEDGPAKAVLASGEPVYWSTLDQRNRDYPDYAGFPSSCPSWAILPLTAHGMTFGVLSVGWADRRRFGREDSALLRVIAHQYAIAVDRARLEEVERSERETLELMSEGTRVMVSELDPASVVRKLVLLAVPRLAPWCAVYVAERTMLRRVAIEIGDNTDLAEELRGLEAVDIGADNPLSLCYRTGKAQVVPRVTEKEVRGYSRAQRERFLSARASWTALIVPIKAGGKVIGVMSLVSDNWGGSPPSGAWHSAEGLAGRAGVALSNAHRYDLERSTASLLSEAVLPRELPDISGYEVASRYIPAEGRVAGDWFDVTRLPSGRVLVGIGDVGGHGISAASLMAQLRNAARGLAIAGGGPADIIRGLDELTLMDDAHGFATALYGSLDPKEGSLLWSSAGHIPPLAFGAGAASWLSFAEHPPLGAQMLSQPPISRHRIMPAEGLVLITDGVVERRGADIGDGLEQFSNLVAGHADASAEFLATAIVGEFCLAPYDDCCIVVLRRV
jgi:GAF domain-containing protein